MMTCPEFVRIDDFLYVKKHTLRYMDTDYSPAYDFVKDGAGTLQVFLKECEREVDGYMVNLVGAVVRIVDRPMTDIDMYFMGIISFDPEAEAVLKLRGERKRAINDLRRQHPVDQRQVTLSSNWKSEHILFIGTHAEREQVMEKLAKVLGSAIRMDKEETS